MTASTAPRHRRPGDHVLLASPGHSGRCPDRSGEILDVLGERGSETYLVRWHDGRLSVVPAGAVAAPLSRERG